MSTQDISIIRKMLSKCKWFILSQKFRFDLGYQFLVLVNFSLLVITSSDKLRYYTGIPRTWILVLIAIPIAFLGMWFLGYFLDNVVHYGQAYNQLAAKRNPLWNEQQQAFHRIEEKLDALRRELGR